MNIVDRIWDTTEEQLAVLEDTKAPRIARDFAAAVVHAALALEPPERTLTRTFLMLRRAIAAGDPIAAEIVGSLPHEPEEAICGSLEKLGPRAFEAGFVENLAAAVVGEFLTRDMAVPAAWMRAILDGSSDKQLTRDRGPLLRLAHRRLGRPRGEGGLRRDGARAARAGRSVRGARRRSRAGLRTVGDVLPHDPSHAAFGLNVPPASDTPEPWRR